MATAAPQPPAVLRFATTTPHPGLMLVDVEGDLEAPAVARWTVLLNSATREGATGIAVDLRGCGTANSACLSVLLAVSARLKARGGGGIKLVTTPGSLLGRKVEAVFPMELPAYSSASEALLSLRDAQ
jgi:anti-anti-sigma regulatory factor